MTQEHLEAKIKELAGELEKAETELSRLRPRVQYLEGMQQRLEGALTVLQGLLEQDRQAVVPAIPAAPNSHAALPVGS